MSRCFLPSWTKFLFPGRKPGLTLAFTLIISVWIEESTAIKCFQCNDVTAKLQQRISFNGSWDGTGDSHYDNGDKQSPSIPDWNFGCGSLERVLLFECPPDQQACFKATVFDAGLDGYRRKRDIVGRGCHGPLHEGHSPDLCVGDKKTSPGYKTSICFCTSDFCNGASVPAKSVLSHSNFVVILLVVNLVTYHKLSSYW